ncbi:hypothetical protein NMY22_g1283 [Coprinellus aureogranulatus]|nr:hypothetical protein NMY22_g1283 [Coprinellus aureogranulatus]
MSAPGGHLNLEELKRRLLSWSLQTRCYPLFKGSSEKLGMWFLTVERACTQSSIPNTQRSEAAIHLIHDDTPLAGVMRERQRVYLEKSGEAHWPWPDFKRDIIGIVMHSAESGWNWKKVAGIALIVAGAAVLVPAVGILALNAIGFTSGGVAAGSLAALIQSVFYGAATGGAFSVFQMLGATAALSAIEAAVLTAAATGAVQMGRRMALRDGRANNGWIFLGIYVDPIRTHANPPADVIEQTNMPSESADPASWAAAPASPFLELPTISRSSFKAVMSWLRTMDRMFQSTGTREEERSEAAIAWIKGSLQSTMERRRVSYLEGKPEGTYWPWEDFWDGICDVVNAGEEGGRSIRSSNFGGSTDTRRRTTATHTDSPSSSNGTEHPSLAVTHNGEPRPAPSIPAQESGSEMQASSVGGARSSPSTIVPPYRASDHEPGALERWIDSVERFFADTNPAEAVKATMAIKGIEGTLRNIMERRHIEYLANSGYDYWKWTHFKESIRTLLTGSRTGRGVRPSLCRRSNVFPKGAFLRPDESSAYKPGALEEWIVGVEDIFRERGIGIRTETETAMRWIQGELRDRMEREWLWYLAWHENEEYWRWADFKEKIREVVAEDDTEPEGEEDEGTEEETGNQSAAGAGAAYDPDPTAAEGGPGGPPAAIVHDPNPLGHLTESELRRRLLSWAIDNNCNPIFKGSPDEMGMWFWKVERACRASDVPATQRTEAAILLIHNDLPLGEIMRTRQREFLRASGEFYWPWLSFKQDLVSVVQEAAQPGGWNWKKAVGVGLVIAAGAVLLPAVGIVLLNLAGFTAGGVAGGSLAALIQSVFYGGATGGLFSLLQGLGATLALPALEAVIVAAGAAGVGGRLLLGDMPRGRGRE